MGARLLPVYWNDATYGVSKGRENRTINERELKDCWNTTRSLIKFNDQSVRFHHEIDDMCAPHMVQPCTKIVVPDSVADDCDGLFNRYWNSLDKGGENEGLSVVLNKTLTMAYVMAGTLYAYENVRDFFVHPQHDMDTKFVNCTRLLQEYLMDKKKSEHKLKDHAIRVTGAQKIIKGLMSDANLEASLAGLTIAGLHRIVNYTRASTDTDMIDAGLDLLLSLNILRMRDMKLFLNPEY